MRSDLDRLRDILRAIDNAERYKDDGEERFQRDELVQVWVVHQLLIIGEAARGLSEKLRGEHPQVPWSQIVALRNVVVHEYFGLNLQQVWMVLVRDLPVLRAEVGKIVDLLRAST
jgi:uncharacterized protein with HEPN domain